MTTVGNGIGSIVLLLDEVRSQNKMQQLPRDAPIAAQA